MIESPDKKWFDIKKIGMGGWNIFDDSSSIADIELADVTNVTYDGGFISPRKGSELLTEKPSGAGSALQSIVARTSDGVEYLIGVYDDEFYLWHEDNEEWVKINQTYAPTETALPYGWVNWNNGRGDDRLYGCNGVDDFFRWDMGVSRLDGDHASGATTVTLTDGTRFPASGGTLVIKGNSGEFTKAYTSRTGNVFTLDGTLGQAVGNLASVTLDMITKADMELGKIVSKHQGRLVVGNYYGGETVFWYSVQNDPEDFTPASTIAGAGTETIADGNGEITGLHDFGEFLVIEKEDSVHIFRFKIADDLGSKLSEIIPIISGQSVGPLGQHSTVKLLNALFYPTRTEGFISLYPAASGGQSGVNVQVISQKIQNYATQEVGFTKCKGVGFDQKIFWAVTLDDGSQNLITLVYDTLRQAWSRIENWAVQDWAYKGGNLFYMDNSTGSFYQVLTGGYHDNNNPYLSEFFSKRYDYGSMAEPKVEDKVYIQGYLTPATDLFVDVLFNEEGTLNKQTYRINKDTEGIGISQPLTNALGEFILGQPALGWVILSEIGDLSFFRCYLGIDITKGFYNLQLRFYQNKEAFYGITGISLQPMLAGNIPPEMVINPI